MFVHHSCIHTLSPGGTRLSSHLLLAKRKSRKHTDEKNLKTNQTKSTRHPPTYSLTFLKIPASNSKTASEMCWLTESYHTLCAHWSVPLVETACPRAECHKPPLLSGCWENQTVGVTCYKTFCRRCRRMGEA